MSAAWFLPSVYYRPLPRANQFLLPWANVTWYMFFSRDLKRTLKREHGQLLSFPEILVWKTQHRDKHRNPEPDAHSRPVEEASLTILWTYQQRTPPESISRKCQVKGREVENAMRATLRSQIKCISFSVKTYFPFQGIRSIKSVMEGGGLVRSVLFYFLIRWFYSLRTPHKHFSYKLLSPTPPRSTLPKTMLHLSIFFFL